MLNGKLLFTAYATANDQGYFVSDGTANGTVQIGFSSPTDQVTLGNIVVLADTQGVRSANIAGAQPDVLSLSSDLLKSGTDALQADSDHAFFLLASGDLMASDGLTDGAILAGDVMKFKVVAENNIYFITETSQATQLWFSDGTEAGTRYVNDLPSAAAYFDLEHAVAVRTVGVNDLPS